MVTNDTIEKEWIITQEKKKEILDSFLYIPKKFKKYIDCGEKIHWIYTIRNLTTGTLYVGKTTSIRRRAKDHINSFIKADTNSKLYTAMTEYGIDAFIMTPIEITPNPESASIKERYYIDKYNTVKNGYNTVCGSASTETREYHRKKGNPQTVYAKLSKSKNMCAVNTKEKLVVFSTGLKLFGDYIGRGKDEIKSAAKRETRMEGFFIYYLNKTDFMNQYAIAQRKNDKQSIYSKCNDQYPDFIKYADYIRNYIQNGDNPEGFKIIFITQDPDSEYKFSDVDSFLSYYKSLSDIII